MDENKVHFRHILLFCFRKGQSAKDARQTICDVYGPRAVTTTTCYSWYKRFITGNFNLEDAPRSGRPCTAHEKQILALIDSDSHLTTREIAEKLDVDFSTVAKRLKGIGMVKKADAWFKQDT